jgi:hypothetical protein
MKKPKKIKEIDVDKVFSLFIRNRDGSCRYPGIHAGNLQNSHFYTRTARSVRWDEENCDALCGKHHQYLEGRKNAEYYEWKLKMLGRPRFEALRRRYVALKQWKQTELLELIEKYSP